MVKIELPAKPDFLTDEYEQELIDKFQKDGSNVWNTKQIKEAVSDIAFGKCIYSECTLGEEGKYMEIDHFFPKKHYPLQVMKWGNLLPSNKKCNATKGETDTAVHKIINPLIHNPKDYLYMDKFRYYAKKDDDIIALNTITYTAINDYIHFTKNRAEICLKIEENLESLNEEIVEMESPHTSNRKKASFKSKVKGLFNQGNRTEAYSAAIATSIIESIYFRPLIDFFKINDWDEEFEEILEELEFCQMSKSKSSAS